LKTLLLAAIFFIATCAFAAELEGVKLEDRLRKGPDELQLNGIALRTRFFFKVYVAGLYLPQKTQEAQAALEMRGPKRMTLVMLRDVDAEQFASALLHGLRDSSGEAELERLKPQIDELMATINRIGEAKKGMIIVLDFAPEAGTTLLVNGAPEGKTIAGDDFFGALLKVWLGEGPVAHQMKKALLGAN
jgi:Chalcone isomerase-like